jgi:hypothetical protein
MMKQLKLGSNVDPATATRTATAPASSNASTKSAVSAAAAAVASIALVCAIATTTGHMVVSTCQEHRLPPNPLWPSGISEQDVNDFVDSVLNDSSINMAAIPDVVERAIYKSTVTMTANLLYQAIGQIHGIRLFGHDLILRRETSLTKNAAMDGQHFGIDEKILEQVADRLMKNNAVNQALVPDTVERQLYINCLKLIIHLLDSIAASLCITFCGHDLRLHFEPSKKRMLAASSTTKLNTKELQEIARKAVDSDGIYGEFQVQLQASLYGLVLGLIDDLLANTEIAMLSDRIEIDIVQGMKKQNALMKTEGSTKADTANSKKVSSLVPFSIGVGVGAAIAVAVLTRTGGANR